jgi:hypothetical protein
MVYNILPIMLSIIAFILYCVISPLFREYLKKWRARRACGPTPREPLVDRAFETSPSVPNASTRPHSHGQCDKIERKNTDISVLVEHVAGRYSLKALNFEGKLAKYKKYNLVKELKYEEN